MREAMKCDNKINRKLKSFLETNFPPFTKADLISNNDDKATVILDYGKSEPLLKVEVVLSEDKYSLYKLADTKFVNR